MAEIDDPQDGLVRKLATILSADVAGYSRLMAEDEEHTLQTFRGHREVFEKLVALHRGRIFNTAGDAILAEFGSAVEAVRCATEIQAALRTRNDHLADERRVEFRIGVNLGDVMVQGEDLLGDGVNLAARLQGAAEPGGVCIAGSVYDQIRNKLSLAFAPLGDINYKNIPQAVRTFAITEAEGLGALPAPAPPPRRTGRFPRRWPAIAASVLLLLAGAGALWAYSEHRRARTELAREAALAARETAAEQARLRSDSQHPAAAQPQPSAPTPSPPSPAALPAAIPATTGPAPPGRTTGSAPPERAPGAAGAADQGAAGAADGLYRGQICYGPGAADAAHCYNAQGIVLHHRISGEWPGRIAGATIFLAGQITPGGDVEIHMHSRRADGRRFAVIDMIGALRNGRINATGGFRNGRRVTLNWRKN